MEKKYLNQNGKRIIASCALVVCVVCCVFAVPQTGALQKGLNAGYQEINTAMSVIKQIVYAIAAVIGLIGAVKVYGKWSEGAPDTSKTAGLWFGGAAFLIVAGIVIDSLFLG